MSCARTHPHVHVDRHELLPTLVGRHITRERVLVFAAQVARALRVPEDPLLDAPPMTQLQVIEMEHAYALEDVLSTTDQRTLARTLE